MWLLIKSITYLFTIYLYSMSAQYLCWKCILAPANQSASQPTNQPTIAQRFTGNGLSVVQPWDQSSP